MTMVSINSTTSSTVSTPTTPTATTQTQSYPQISLIFFILLSIIVAGLSIYDVIQQTLEKVKSIAILETTITIGSFLLVALGSVLITISRFLTVRRALTGIPKAYIPITERDLSRSVYDSINLEYLRTSVIYSCNNEPARFNDRKRIGLQGWGRPGTIFESKRFSDEILKGLAEFDRLLEEYLPGRSLGKSRIPTHRSTLESPLMRYRTILDPQSPNQPTPILLTPAHKVLFRRYLEITNRALRSNSNSLSPDSKVVDEQDFEFCCKTLMVLVERIESCKSQGWKNPTGFGDRDDPIYRGIRFRDAILNSAILLEESLEEKLRIKSQHSAAQVQSRMTNLRQNSLNLTTTTATLTNNDGVANGSSEPIDARIRRLYLSLSNINVTDDSKSKDESRANGMNVVLNGFCDLIKRVEGLDDENISSESDPNVELRGCRECTRDEYEYCLRCVGILKKLH
ncbi:hypothetical protein BY996DRAFT_6429529 [Phakopsora pachyrhizi]|nr:hypothetical protein BY996DRAFT_6429529 [Phakopsora pachyrhizi]